LEIRKKGDFIAGLPVSQKLVNLIESHADELTMNWLLDVKRREDMPTYRTYDEKELYERAFTVYSQLGKWISMETTTEEIASYYKALGAQRRKEGFALSEVIQALIAIRRQIWLKVQAEGFLDTVLDLSQTLELYNHVLRFFDRAIFFAAIGYEKGERKNF